MDVRCERCKTEYEFDDARISEAGVTVKCTTCGHVFKVKKKSAPGASIPVHPGEDPIADSPTLEVPRASAPQREWKVRQSTGNLFTFKELTTLQKWIVERKVTRDDEISLTGESWKRLGNIAELASFFQVVDEAQKGSQLAALQSQAYLGLGATGLSPPAGYAMPTVPANPGEDRADVQYPVPAVRPPTTEVPELPPEPRTLVPAVMAPSAPLVLSPVREPEPVPRPETVGNAHRGGPSSMGVGLRQPVNEPAFAREARPLVGSADEDHDDDLAAAAFQRQSRGGRWVVALLFLAGLGAAGYFGYFQYFLSPGERSEASLPAAEPGVTATGMPGSAGLPQVPGAPAAPGPTGAAAPPSAGATAAGGTRGTPSPATVPGAAATLGLPATTATTGVAAPSGAVAAPGSATPTVSPPIGLPGAPATTALPGASAAGAVAGTTSGRLSPEGSPNGSTKPVPGNATSAKSPGAPSEKTPAHPGSGAEAKPTRDFDSYMAQGDRLREREKATAALDAYDKAIELHDDRAEPYAGKGLAHFDLTQYPQAETSFKRALELNPRYGVAIIGLAETYRAQDKKTEAISFYEKYLEALPNGPEASVARSAIEKLNQ